jgi:hypothetical protein
MNVNFDIRNAGAFQLRKLIQKRRPVLVFGVEKSVLGRLSGIVIVPPGNLRPVPSPRRDPLARDVLVFPSPQRLEMIGDRQPDPGRAARM